MAALSAGLAVVLLGATLTQGLADGATRGGSPVRSLVHVAAPAADPPSLAMSASVSPSPLVVGGTAVYTVTVTNTGTSDATNVVSTLPFDPAGTVTIGALPTGCTAAGQTVTCTQATIAAGDSVAYTIPVTVLPSVSDGTNVTLRATVTAAGGVSANTDLITQAFTQVDVQIRKFGPATVSSGGTITWTIVVTNHGPSDAATVTWHDPTNGNQTTITSYPCGNTGLTVTCDVGTMTPGERRVFHITAKVNDDVPAGTVITNCATVDTGTRPETNPDNNQSCADTYVDPVAPVSDVEVTKKAPATAHAGDTITYSVSVTNLGPDAARRVIVKDPLDEPLVSVVSLPAGCVERGGTVICNAGRLAVGQTKTFTFTVRIADGLPEGTQISDCAQATSTSSVLKAVQGTPSCVQTNIVPDAASDIALTKTGPAEVSPGAVYSYTLIATNNGPNPAADVVVTDPTDPSLVTVTSVPPGCTQAGGTVTCDAGTLAVGDSRTFTITVQVNPGVRRVVIPNCATGSTSTEDTNLNNNQECVNTAVDLVNPGNSDIRLVKRGPAVVRPGSTMTYSIDVTNDGPDAAFGVIVGDAVDTSVLTVTSLPPGCLLHGTAVVCLIGSLGVHETKTLTFTVAVSPDAVPGSQITNCGSVGGQRSLLRQLPGDACVQTTVLPTRSARLRITKSSPAQVRADGTITFTVTVTNRGPNAATNVIVTDPVPNLGLVTVVSLPSGCTDVSGSISCQLGTLLPGQTKQLTYSVRVAADAANGAVITNCATAYSTTRSSDLGNSQACASTVVRHVSDLEVVKTGPATVAQGETAGYRVTVINRGPDSAENVVITDQVDPSAVSVVSLSSGCSLVGATITCRAGALAVGQAKTFHVTVEILSGAGHGTRIENCAAASSDRTILKPAAPRSCTVATIPTPFVPVTG